jgi:hypothetical protein
MKKQIKKQTTTGTVTVRSKRGSKTNFTQVSNDAIYDVGLSPTARHLLTILLSFPEYYHCKRTDTLKEWKIIDDYLMELLLCCRETLQKLFKELRVAGFVTLYHPRGDDGKMKGTRREFDYYPIFNDFDGTPERKEYDDDRAAFNKKHKNKDREPTELANDCNEESLDLDRNTENPIVGKTCSHLNNKNNTTNTDSNEKDYILIHSDPTKEIAHNPELERCIKKDKAEGRKEEEPPKNAAEKVVLETTVKSSQNAMNNSDPLKQCHQQENEPPRAFKEALSSVAANVSHMVSYKSIPSALIYGGTMQEILSFVGVQPVDVKGWVNEFGDTLYMMFSELKEYATEINVVNVGGWFRKRVYREREARKLAIQKV